jgi:hypothetical protein
MSGHWLFEYELETEARELLKTLISEQLSKAKFELEDNDFFFNSLIGMTIRTQTPTRERLQIKRWSYSWNEGVRDILYPDEDEFLVGGKITSILMKDNVVTRHSLHFTFAIQRELY